MLATQRIAVDALNVGASEVVLYYTNGSYFNEDEALGRLIRILMKDVPADIEKFRLMAP